MEVVGSVTETCDKEAGQKPLLKGSLKDWRKCRERNAESPE